ncbi:MAG: endo-1,4-beta-xylanase, partial [Bacteroidales bacterium]|nr:endo-1,4-beta-xylanase [Bacteroidales bacterium]
QAPAETGEIPALKDVYKDAFKIGAAVSSFDVSGRSPETVDLILKHFNSLTPGNELKPESLHPRPDVWNWERADRYVDFAVEHGMFTMGHTLCWHNQTPEFFWNDKNGNPKSHDELVETLRSYIETVCTHFKGRVDAWDVINEIVSEQGGYRDKGWVHAFGGEEYGDEIVKTVFRFAEQYAPDTELYYNEFNVWRPSKLEGVLHIVKMLKEEGIRIDGVGIQAHWGLNYPKNEYVVNAIEKIAALGVKVMITEIDIDVLPLTREGQVIGQVMSDPQFQLEEFKEYLDPYRDGLPADVEKQLADRYEELFKIFYDHRDVIDRVTFWGVQDGGSWKNGYPVPGRTNYPLLFRRDLTPHDAFFRVAAIPNK